jgi:hypothetical protein
MSKMNRVRIINLNYNNNAIRIDDETFLLGGESTLFSLRNGGGKSVLVQILTAPFVHKRYRDTKDRPFQSYFTTNKPTFILVEWALDGGAGYVLTGMMVRKSQEDNDGEIKEDIEVVQFIHEYKHANSYDIEHIPFIEQTQDGTIISKKLKGFHGSKQLLESLKQDKNLHFDVYDMSVPTRARMYYDKLNEYQIYYKEWESIIKKVNLKESGLSELFMDAKDESGLIEKWFLDAVENKLNKEENKIKEFGQILLKYIKQYKENKIKIERKASISEFKHETNIILEKAEELLEALKEKSELENKIANLITGLKYLKDLHLDEKQAIEDTIRDLEESINDILYEEISYGVYGFQDEKDEKLRQSQVMNQEVQEGIQEKERLEKKRQIQECARLYKDFKEVAKEVQSYESDLEIAKQKNKDLTPERNLLGFNLKCYYDKKVLEKKEKLEDLNLLIRDYQEKIKDKKKIIASKEQQEKENISKEGQLSSQIMNYDEVERNFNLRYNESLSRNIIGEYEEGILASVFAVQEETLKVKTGELNRIKNIREDNEQKLYSYSRDLEDFQKEVGGIQTSITLLEKELKTFEERILTRKTLVQYINLSEDNIFQTELILNKFNTKIQELEYSLKEYEKEYGNLQSDYKKLESGKVMELPEELEEMLESEGIHYVYGMEWLKKNQKSTLENKKLVETNPFIPYGIIMSEKELNKLVEKQSSIFTSFPIPIIKRETLEAKFHNGNPSIVSGDRVSFYVLFNQNLLDEEELNILLASKEKEIGKIMDMVRIKGEEISFYREKRDQIKYDQLLEKDYRSCQNKLKSSIVTKVNSEARILEMRQTKKQIEDNQKKIVDSIHTESNDIKELLEKQKDLKELSKRYENYLELRKSYDKIKDQIKTIEVGIKETKDQIDELEELVKETIDSKIHNTNEFTMIQDKLLLYINYKEGERIEKSIEEIEARYEAITKELTVDQQIIEEHLDRLRKKFSEKEEDLGYKAKRFQLQEEDFKNEVYDRFLDEELERKIRHKDNEIEKLKEQKSILNTQVAVLTSNIGNKMKELEEKLQKSDLKPRSSIVVTEFKKQIKEKELEKNKEYAKLEGVKNKLFSYEDNLSNLVEYEHLKLESSIDFDLPLIEYNREDLKKLRGNLLRDYKSSDQQIHERKQELYEAMHLVMKKDVFQDDFFKKPLETMYPLLNNPTSLLDQLTMTISSYDSLLLKLEVDIALVDEEKSKVTDMLLEYVGEVHSNLGKIDKNSTIRIRERSIKMLRIKLPDWSEQEMLYLTRLRDFIDGLTESGLYRLERNESIEELIGSQMTTKNLYDTVVGIGNIEIKLYKVEEQREYQITWAEVSKNSGGEGFLSAFVILSSLLSFMRRDDTDIFSEYEEGKVLIMDNPFAQTNAAHLLKPLMDIANKTNTQLICLSGLGGESIYNRFDNIYVLNLITSDLRRGMQYLRGEHAKGEDEIQTMSSSRVSIEGAEQIELLF